MGHARRALSDRGGQRSCSGPPWCVGTRGRCRGPRLPRACVVVWRAASRAGGRGGEEASSSACVHSAFSSAAWAEREREGGSESANENDAASPPSVSAARSRWRRRRRRRREEQEGRSFPAASAPLAVGRGEEAGRGGETRRRREKQVAFASSKLARGLCVCQRGRRFFSLIPLFLTRLATLSFHVSRSNLAAALALERGPRTRAKRGKEVEWFESCFGSSSRVRLGSVASVAGVVRAASCRSRRGRSEEGVSTVLVLVRMDEHKRGWSWWTSPWR